MVQAGKLKEGVQILETLVGQDGVKLTKEEAAAANYNLACALSQLRQFDKVGEPLTRAVNDYGVKYSTVMSDDDLEPYRMSRSFDDVANNLKGGVASDEQYNKFRVEARSPFRTFRLFALGGLDAGAGIGLLIILTRLAAALNGGPGAPELKETVQNLAINLTAVIALTFFFVRDLKDEKEKLKEVEMEESAGKLLVDMGANRVVPLSRLRQQYRPVILFGDNAHLKKSIKSASLNKRDLQAKGILIIPLEEDKSGFSFKRTQSLSESKGFDASSSSAPASDIEQEIRWVVQPRETREWQEWVEEQRQEAQSLRYAEAMYVQIQLDGTVRAVGLGQPNWKDFLRLPDREDFRSKVAG